MNKYSDEFYLNLLDSISLRVKKLEEHHVRQIDENRKVSQRLDELTEQMERQFEKNRLMVDIIDELRKKDEFLYTQIHEKFDRLSDKKEKKTGLSFEEAFKALMKGKKIHRNSNYGNTIVAISGRNIFSMNDIRANDWEIVE